MIMEKRELRVQMDRGLPPVACDLRAGASHQPSTYRLANISRTGMFLEGLPADTEVVQGGSIRFSMRVGSGEDVAGVGRVRWIRPNEEGPYQPRGIGIQVVAFDDNAERLYLDFLESCLVNLKITDLMDPNFLDVPPDASVRDVLALMRQRNGAAVVVTDGESAPLGIFTRGDLVKIVDEGLSLAGRVDQFMTRAPVVVTTDQSTDDAYSIMRYGSLNHLPVLEEGIVVGVLSTRDLVRYWAEFMDLQAKRLTRGYEHAMSVIAHDLRTPLGLIKTTNLMVMTGAVEPKEYLSSGLAESVDSTCHMMMGLIDEILDVGTVTLGGIKLAKAKIDVYTFLEKIRRWFEPSARSKNISLSLDVEEDLPELAADPLKLEQVMNNLVGNALKFTPKGGCVFLGAALKHSRIALSVADTGPGIEPSERDKLFRDFTRLSPKPTGGERSTGLGLAIVKRIVEAHQGIIEVESRPGFGTLFRVLLSIGEIQ